LEYDPEISMAFLKIDTSLVNRNNTVPMPSPKAPNNTPSIGSMDDGQRNFTSPGAPATMIMPVVTPVVNPSSVVDPSSSPGSSPILSSGSGGVGGRSNFGQNKNIWVASFNVLSHGYLVPKFYPTPPYQFGRNYCYPLLLPCLFSHLCLDWCVIAALQKNLRYALAEKNLTTLGADIVCMQVYYFSFLFLFIPFTHSFIHSFVS
jgi:hypothetical protein